jgi:hypothetical protein
MLIAFGITLALAPLALLALFLLVRGNRGSAGIQSLVSW